MFIIQHLQCNGLLLFYLPSFLFLEVLGQAIIYKFRKHEIVIEWKLDIKKCYVQNKDLIK